MPLERRPYPARTMRRVRSSELYPWSNTISGWADTEGPAILPTSMG